MHISCKVKKFRANKDMLTTERKAFILDLLRRDRRVVAKALSQELGLVRGHHPPRPAGAGGGGASAAGPWRCAPCLAGDSGDCRRAGRSRLIPRIGRAAAARMVRPGQVVILDGGTTAVQMARHLPQDLRATIVTHSPSVALELWRNIPPSMSRSSAAGCSGIPWSRSGPLPPKRSSGIRADCLLHGRHRHPSGDRPDDRGC